MSGHGGPTRRLASSSRPRAIASERPARRDRAASRRAGGRAELRGQRLQRVRLDDEVEAPSPLRPAERRGPRRGSRPGSAGSGAGTTRSPTARCRTRSPRGRGRRAPPRRRRARSRTTSARPDGAPSRSSHATRPDSAPCRPTESRSRPRPSAYSSSNHASGSPRSSASSARSRTRPRSSSPALTAGADPAAAPGRAPCAVTPSTLLSVLLLDHLEAAELEPRELDASGGAER